MSKTIRADEINLDGEVTVTGNLTVIGGVAEIATTNITISDNIITLNTGETAAGVSQTYAGVEVDRGSLPTTSIRWNETTNRWELTQDGSSYAFIATSAGTGFTLENIVEDLTPQLGADLDINGYSITSLINVDVVVAPGENAVLQVDSPVLMQNAAIPPSMTAGYATLYAGDVNGGGTGVYVSNSEGQPELVSKKRAIIFGLIF